MAHLLQAALTNGAVTEGGVDMLTATVNDGQAQATSATS